MVNTARLSPRTASTSLPPCPVPQPCQTSTSQRPAGNATYHDAQSSTRVQYQSVSLWAWGS